MSSQSKANSKQRRKGFSRGEKIVGLVILVVAIWAVYSFAQPSPPSNTITNNTITTTGVSGAPDFTLPVVGSNGLTGEKISLSQFKGKVVFLEFMVPWCGHCQNMAPVLESLYKQYRSQNVVFISVSGAWNGATVDDAAQFIRTYHSDWIYVYDSSGAVFNSYGVTATPTFFIITKNGVVANTYSGEVAFEIFAADLTRLVS